MAADPVREGDIPPPPRPVAALSARDDGLARAGRLTVLAPGGPRRHSTLYSQIVGFMKFLLPAVALGIATLVLLWPQLNPLDQRFRLTPVQVSIEDLENLRMVQPRYVGVDERNQPYSIIAEQATQAKGSSESTDLAEPQGDLTMQQGTWLALTADHGLYHQPEKMLDLWGGVSLFHDGGYEIETERASVDLGHGSAEGDSAVQGQGPNSVLTGQGFRILDRGARIEVRGQSRVVLYPSPSAGAAALQTAQQPAQMPPPPPPPTMGPRK